MVVHSVHAFFFGGGGGGPPGGRGSVGLPGPPPFPIGSSFDRCILFPLHITSHSISLGFDNAFASSPLANRVPTEAKGRSDTHPSL